MNNFSIRLKEAMENRDMKRSDLVQLTGICKSSVSQYLTGVNEPKQDKIKLLAEALNVNEKWLSGHDVPMDEDAVVVEAVEEKNISIRKASQLMGKSEQFIRYGLQQSIFTFGTAVKIKARWGYYISPKKFYEYLGSM